MDGDTEIKEVPFSPTSIIDGLENLAMGLGTSKDKGSHNTWNHSGRNYDHIALSARYREDWLTQKFISIIPQDMCRDWREFEEQDHEDADGYFEVKALFEEAYRYARLYGTSFIVMDIADGRSQDKPVNEAKLGEGCLRSMHVVDRTRIVAAAAVDQNPISVTYGMPDLYQVVGMNTHIHKSRLIRFEGTELPTFQRLHNLWYSDSVLIPLLDLFDSFHVVEKATTQMSLEASVDVVAINGLSELLQNSRTAAALQQRFLDWKNIKSSFGVSLIDSREEYEQKSMQLNGISDMLWKKLEVVAAAVSIPATRFLSASPQGLSNNGGADIINYAEHIGAKQRAVFDPRLKVVDNLIAKHFGLSQENKGKIPVSPFKYEWRCVFPESNEGKEARLNSRAVSLGILADSGIVSRESALQSAIDIGIVGKDASVGTDPNAQTGTSGNSSSNGVTNKTTK